ncbi:hypothetical protein [Streptomyces sp. BPTC-684]|uniref:hypothetical protein n=1 Tax=Streptomyces sp. BPTC-684 TaxID=3043734 RepID=UPI0024B1AE8E|nr:hypothetical protein [Streptomyces sp. BPTC-684]WHM37515.1 hypothetical protein QIY60_11745 [Streptomyces sp. BPTC-684]
MWTAVSRFSQDASTDVSAAMLASPAVPASAPVWAAPAASDHGLALCFGSPAGPEPAGPADASDMASGCRLCAYTYLPHPTRAALPPPPR